MAASASTTFPGTAPRPAAVAPAGWADNPGVVAVVFALKTLLAGLLALFLAFWLELDEPRWALLTVFIVSQPDSGLVLAKGFYRILGTIAGLLVSIVLVFGLSQYGELFLAVVALWIGLCTFAAGALRNFASYGFLLAGYSVAVVGIPAAVNPDQAFPILLARFTEIILGIVCASLVSRLVFPRDLMPKLVALVHALRLRAECLGAAITRLDWQDLAGERRQFLADFAAVETTRASAYFESPEARVRNATLRQLAGAALHVSAVAETSARRTGAPLGAGVPQIADLIRATPDTPQGNGEAVFRIVDAVDARALAEAVVHLRATAAAFDQGTNAAGDVGRGFWSDPVAAALTGIRSALAVAIASAFWIATGWPSGAIAVTIAANMCSLFSAMEQPVKVSLALVATLLIAFLPVFATVFGLLPRATDFVSMSVALAPLLLACGVIIARQPLGLFPVTYFTVGSNIDNVMNYDLSTFLNTSIAILTGMGFALVSFAVFFPETPRRIGDRFRRQLLVRLGRLCSAQHPTVADHERTLYERLAATVTRLKNEPATARACIAGAIAALSISRAVEDLRTAIATGRLPAAMTAGISRLLTDAAAGFLHPSRRRSVKTAWDARALRWRALAPARSAEDELESEALAATLAGCEVLRSSLLRAPLLLREVPDAR
ncbi:MAG: FUSC family protein [Xanthobacteraceae bacterium]|jgi:uncharacterized membrane protein YccC